MLRELQAAFGAGLLEGFDAPPPPDLVAGDPARAARRFLIHRGTVAESLAITLSHTYPAARALCGAANFRVLAISYVRAHPPRRPALFAYGEGFADHVASHAAAIRDLPFLPDLCRLEWALNLADFAEEASALTPAALGAVPQERLPNLRLRLHPAAHLVASETHPIHAIWTRALGHVSETPLALGPLPDHGETVLVTRPANAVSVLPLDPGQHAFLRAVESGASLEDAATAAFAAETAFDFPVSLAAFLNHEAFAADISFDPDRPSEPE